MKRERTQLRPRYSLWLHTNYRDGATPIIDLTNIHSDINGRVSHEGSDSLSFTINRDQLEFSRMAEIYSTRVGSEIRVLIGGRRVWRGLIRKLVLSTAGQAHSLSLDKMANVAICKYDGGGVAIGQNDSSRAIYGSKTIVLDDSSLSGADAQKKVDKYVYYRGWPIHNAFTSDDETSLRVECIGYNWILEWERTAISSGVSVQSALRKVISDCGNGVITWNEDSIQDNGETWNSDIDGTGLDLIRKVTDMLDANGKVWQWYIDGYGVFHFKPIVFDPYYYKITTGREISRGIYVGGTSGNRADLSNAMAGVVLRNLSFPITQSRLGSPYNDARDIYVESFRFTDAEDITFEDYDSMDDAIVQGDFFNKV